MNIEEINKRLNQDPNNEMEYEGFDMSGCKLKYSKNNNWIAEVAHIDHIHPFSKKETYPNRPHNINESSNLQALCPACNLKKSNKEVQ